MKILLVEDDYLQACEIVDMLKEQYQDVDIIDVGTEARFRALFSELAKNPPSLVILDVMMKWTDSLKESVPPDDIQQSGYYRSGIRCLDMLQSDETLRSVPVILYSALERQELTNHLADKPDHVIYLQKQPTPDQLAIQIRSLLIGGNLLPKERRATLWHRLWSAVELKPGAWGVAIDLKRLSRKSGRDGNGNAA